MVDELNASIVDNISTMSYLDIFMVVKYLKKSEIRAMMGEDKLNFVWDLAISELTIKHVNRLDQKNLAIICKTVADN